MGQTSRWIEEGHEIKIFMHSDENQYSLKPINGEVFYYQGKNFVSREIGRIPAAKKMIEKIKIFNPNLIYLRYGMYVYPIQKLIKIAPVVEELITNDIFQHKKLGFILYLYNLLTRGFLLKRVNGLVCISKEIANFPFNKRLKKPAIIVGDGIDTKITMNNFPPANEIPIVGFIGRPKSIWQGVDKLIQLASLQPDINIYVIGTNREEIFGKKPENIRFFGFLEKNEYSKVLKLFDCAIGSLALHRINLNESSPLKTRECLRIGTPMILPYKDTDLDNFSDETILKIPNSENNILLNSRLIRDFAYKMKGKRVPRKIINSIDIVRKEKKRLEFLDFILSQYNK